MKKLRIFSIILILIIGLLIALFFLFRLKNVNVNGCRLSNEAEVREAVLSNAKFDNVIMLYIKNKIDPIENIPFVAKLDISYSDRNTVNVTVYEKQIAGCVEYMNSYIFFDKDGIVLETSSKLKTGIPCIRGIKFMSWEMGKGLPINDVSKFDEILSITQLMEKYDLNIEMIEFTKENEIVLFYEDIEIQIGDGNNLPVQMMNLGSILEQIKGKKGVLYMKDYDSDNSSASFKTN